jgi:hypothetical protein
MKRRYPWSARYPGSVMNSDRNSGSRGICCRFRPGSLFDRGAAQDVRPVLVSRLYSLYRTGAVKLARKASLLLSFSMLAHSPRKGCRGAYFAHCLTDRDTPFFFPSLCGTRTSWPCALSWSATFNSIDSSFAVPRLGVRPLGVSRSVPSWQ